MTKDGQESRQRRLVNHLQNLRHQKVEKPGREISSIQQTTLTISNVISWPIERILPLFLAANSLLF